MATTIDHPATPAAGGGWGLPAAVLAAGAGVTLALAVWSLRTNAAERQALFERRAEIFSQALGSRVQSYIDTIPGLRVAAMPGDRASDDEFLRYVQAISLQQRFPGLALSFIADRVPAGQRAAYVASVRADRSRSSAGHPDFDIRPPGERDEYMVLRHLYPFNQPSFGYDLYDPQQRYRGPVDTAIDTGQYVATGPIRLARDRSKPQQAEITNVVIRAAVYAGGAVPDSAEARRAAAVGVVGVAFRTQELVQGVLPSDLGRAARVRIIDTTARREAQPDVVFDSEPRAAPGDASPAHEALVRLSVKVADRSWQIELAPHAASVGADMDATTWSLLLLGLATSLSLALMTRTLTRANRIADRRIMAATAELEAEKEELARSESRYRMLFENSFDALFRTRPDGRVLAANPAACALFGMTEAELRQAGRERLVDQSDPRLQELIDRRASEGRAQGQMTMIRADGSRFESDVSSNLYRDGDGELVASLIVRDISERQRAAEERQQLEAQLRHSQKMQAVGTLAGGVAHEFNNMLAVVLGNAAMVQQDIGSAHPASAALDLIRQAALRARSLVQQILTFSRPQAEYRSAQPLRPLVEEALALLRVTLPATVQLEARFTDQPLAVVTDATQIQQIVINLCTNAWQAMPGHKGHISVSLDRLAAVVDARGHTSPGSPGPGSWARLRIADDGAGMDEATRARIFEPFFTTKPVGQGTGLGLAVVHGIVEAHGGTIRVESTPGAGTTFDLFLPLVATADAGAGAQRDKAAGSARRGQGQHLLYIDDDEVVALTVAALLQRLGYRVSCHADPRVALDELAARPDACQLVVTDFNMPGMSGLEVAAAVRRLRADLPVVITSGHVSDELLLQARAEGVSRVMLKEYTLEHLGGIVAELVADPPETHTTTNGPP